MMFRIELCFLVSEFQYLHGFKYTPKNVPLKIKVLHVQISQYILFNKVRCLHF